MQSSTSRPLRHAEHLIRTLVVLNYAYGAGILAMLVASVMAPVLFFTALGVQPGIDMGPMTVGARLIMVVGLVTVPINYSVLSRLGAIVRTVHDGDPFINENAVRLRSIAWAALSLEVMHLGIGAIAAAAGSRAQPLDIGWRFSFTPWLVVLLLFVLAEVFDHGAFLRAELEGTV